MLRCRKLIPPPYSRSVLITIVIPTCAGLEGLFLIVKKYNKNWQCVRHTSVPPPCLLSLVAASPILPCARGRVPSPAATHAEQRRFFCARAAESCSAGCCERTSE